MSEDVLQQLVAETDFAGEGRYFSKRELVGPYVEAYETPVGVVFESQPSMSVQLDAMQRVCLGYIVALIAFEAEVLGTAWQTPKDVHRLVGDVPWNNGRALSELTKRSVLSEVDG